MAADARGRAFLHTRYWPTWVGLGLLRLLCLLPLPVIAAIGAALGALLCRLHGSRRHIAHVNIARCFPELDAAQRDALVRAHFRGFAQSALDIGIAWWGSRRRLARLTRIRGREHYERALAAGDNIVLLAPHFFGLEIGGMRLSMERPIVTVFRDPDNRLLSAVMRRARSRFSMLLVEYKKPLTALIREVRAGKPLYYLPDQDAGARSSVFVPFFGIQTATFAVLGRLAALTNAVVIPCWTRQLPRGAGYEIVFEEPLKDFPTGDPQTDAARMNAAIERAVRQAPAQYFWVHRRFKTRPPGEPDFY
jgi:Kdo2-lipid IVA lauroyltransferase/acyltransferase